MCSGPGGAPVVVTVCRAGAGEPVLAECLRRVRASRRVRVRMAGEAPVEPGAEPPGGFRLELPGYAGLGRWSLAWLLDHARDHPAGPVHVLLPGAADGAEPVRLWRGTAGGADPAAAPRWEAASRFGIVDLRQPAGPREPLLVRAGQWLRDRLPAPAYSRFAPPVKELRRRVRNRLFLD